MQRIDVCEWKNVFKAFNVDAEDRPDFDLTNAGAVDHLIEICFQEGAHQNHLTDLVQRNY